MWALVRAIRRWMFRKTFSQMFSHQHQFEAIRTIWPYAEGWGVWCPGCKTILETGISSREVAFDAAEAENDLRQR